MRGTGKLEELRSFDVPSQPATVPGKKGLGLVVEEALQLLFNLKGEMRPRPAQVMACLGIEREWNYKVRVENALTENGLAWVDEEGGIELTDGWRGALDALMEALGIFEADEAMRSRYEKDRREARKAEAGRAEDLKALEELLNRWDREREEEEKARAQLGQREEDGFAVPTESRTEHPGIVAMDPERRIRRLVREGMSERWARAAVQAKLEAKLDEAEP